VNESIRIGEIEIMVTKITVSGMELRGAQVKLGIDAPAHMVIDRVEKPKKGGES
jgi:sRNA-binding carbon storage regulator CsrA